MADMYLTDRVGELAEDELERVITMMQNEDQCRNADCSLK